MTTKIMLACMVEMAGMQAENQVRIHRGERPAYDEDSFVILARKYGLDKQPTPAPEPLKQVPSDEKPIRELVKYLRQLYGNNALPYGEALDNLIAEVERRISRIGQPANPSPVTATMWEQAVNELESKLYCSALDATDEYAVANFNDAFSFLRTRLAAAQQVPASARVPIGSWLDEGALDKGLDETLKHVSANKGWSLDLVKGCIRGDIAEAFSRMGQPASPDAPLTWSEAFAEFRGKVRDAISPVYPSNPCSTDDEIIKAIREAVRSSLQPAQPSPVTVEKLAEKIRTIPNPWKGEIDFHQNIRLATRQGFEECREIVLQMLKAFTTLVQGNQPELAEQLQVQLAGCSTAALGNTKNPAKKGDYGWSPAYQDVLELRWKFDALSQERLTREQIEAAVGKFQAKLPTTLAQALKIVGFCQELIDDLMALQPQAQVTREQWERLWPKGYLTSHRPTENDIRAWLKSEFSMEVVDHE